MQFLMAASRQQAGKADAGSADIIPWPRIRPGSPEQAEESIRPVGRNFTGTAQLAPPVLDEREVINAVVLDRLPQAVQPRVPSLSICGSRDRDRQQFVLRPVDRAAESSGRSIDVLECRPDPLHQAYDAVSGSHRICSDDFLDRRHSFLQSLAGEMRTPPSECPRTKPRLECPCVFRHHRRKIFCHTARPWP